VDIISDGGATWLSGDSEVGFTGVKEPGRVIAPDEPLDPQNFQLEELSWWQKVSLYFAGTYNPDVYKTADDLYKKARVVYRGAAYFDEKTDGTSTPAMVVTPTAAIVPNGTSFLVEVAKDGETTVTTLSGSVVVADLKSGKTVSVGVNQAITIPKTPDGLSAKELQQGLTTVIIKPIDAWWLEKTNEMSVLAAKEAAEAGGRANQAVAQAFNLKNKIFFASLIGLFIVVLIVISVMRSKAARKK
jgi:hypothetical protein